MTENKIDIMSRIKDITLKIDFHENRISMHSSAIKKLRNERAILVKMKKGLDEDEKSELLPCPFCGSAAYVTKNPFTGHYSVKCRTCGAKMTGEMVSSGKAIEKWNRRDNHGSNKE